MNNCLINERNVIASLCIYYSNVYMSVSIEFPNFLLYNVFILRIVYSRLWFSLLPLHTQFGRMFLDKMRSVFLLPFLWPFQFAIKLVVRSARACVHPYVCVCVPIVHRFFKQTNNIVAYMSSHTTENHQKSFHITRAK